MRITYKDLATKSYSQLIREGATENQILSKVSSFYLKEQRILTINEQEGKTLSRAIRLLKRGNVSQGTWIPETQYETTKKDVKALKKISKTIGNNSFASRILDEYENGAINPYQLNSIMHSYANNPAQYEEKEGIEEIELLVEGYND